MKPEMLLEKLQKLVTSVNDVEFKVQLLKWWNSSLILWYSIYFLPPNVKEEPLKYFLIHVSL